MLPGHLIDEYWREVHLLLREEYDLSEEQALHGIKDYRQRLDMHRVGDLVYHNGAAHVARTIAGAVESGGFREPGEAAQEKK